MMLLNRTKFGYQISVEEVARVIVSAAVSDNPDPRYFIGKYSKMMFEIKRTMPDSMS
ncbi:MAG: hypothetical protein WA421_01075 [Nitrososphaeraceae archaeon]|jgi:hypothetical protein